MNLKVVQAILGNLALACGVLLLLPMLLSFFLADSSRGAFIVAVFASLLVGYELKVHGKLVKDSLSVREGIAITGLGWLLVSLLGMIPYLAGGYLGGLDSLVESISGFSGTGATVVDDIEVLPKSILLWRSMTNWIGGLGIIVIFMAILPQFGRGAVYMINAESTGATNERQLPRIKDNAKALFYVYIVFTFVATIAYALCGMEPFAALNHAMTTIATGGFSTYNDSAMHDDNWQLEACMSFFMIISSGSFAMYVMAWRHGMYMIWKNTEFKAFLLLIIVACGLIIVDLMVEMNMGFSDALRFASFQVASIASTTGFVSYDFDTWPGFSKGVLLLLMFLGGCAGSTSGGLKISRLVLLLKSIQAIVRQKLHPQMVVHVRMNGQIVPEEVILSVSRHFFVYVMIDVLFAFVMIFDGISMIDSVSVSVSTMGSVGPGFGIAGATSTYALLPSFSKAVACFSMFLGRLEIFTVIAMFTPEFWRKNKGW